ncbi:MAG: hypothetical protein RL469_1194 [Pseudomonadota bacterium]|jgi:hypothetical protein|nr:endonuclease/exonuclease/phosphatase family protein [Gammaproteobacteria bacterium]
MNHSSARSVLATKLLLLLLTSALAPIALAQALPGITPAVKAPGTLRIATWNLEWLIAPRDFPQLARDCVPPKGESNNPRSIPCDVATEGGRVDADFEALARYARALDADVVSLQEVDGVAAAGRVFKSHSFCLSSRPNVQNNGFAIRQGIPFRCGTEVVALGLGGRVRYGVELVLYPGTAREMFLLSVHLKSGCPRQALDSRREACVLLARQVPELERWIDAQAAAGHRFAVLGDFNRDLLADRGPARDANGVQLGLWNEIDDGDPTGAKLSTVAEGQPYSNCASTQNYQGYIDHVVLGAALAAWRVPNSFVRLTYADADAASRKLSDHCPVGVDLQLPR